MALPKDILDNIYKYTLSGETEKIVQFLVRLAENPQIPPKAAGHQIGECLHEAYNDLYIAEVQNLIQAMQGRVLPEITKSIYAVMEPLFNLTKSYGDMIAQIYQERLSREIRDALRGKDVDAAVVRAEKIMMTAKDEQNLTRLAGYIGAMTGSLIHDQKHVQAMIAGLGKRLIKNGYSHELLDIMDKQRQDRMDTIYRTRIETTELDWTRSLTEAIVSVKNKLPDRFRMNEPEETEMKAFRDVACSLFRIPFFNNNEDKWIDVINVLVDFCPRDLGGLAATVGVEARSYNTLGITARRIVNRNFERLGKLKIVQDEFLKIAENNSDSGYYEKIIEMMGALRNESFYPILNSTLESRKFKHIRGVVIDAIGQVGGIESRTRLLQMLAEDCQGLIDPPKVREANRIISALGKILRHPRITPSDRNEIVSKAMSIIPKNEKRVSMNAAIELFTFNSNDIKDEYISWAATILAESLWLTDESPDFAKGEERPSSLLGFRERMANALVNFGERAVPSIIAVAEANFNRYSGAFLAIGDIFTKIGTPATIGIIEKLLLTSFIVDEAAINKYSREFYWDAAEEKRKPLDKDKIISTLLFAVKKIGGKEADLLLRKLFNKIKTGGLANPGPETAKQLVDSNIPIAGIPERDPLLEATKNHHYGGKSTLSSVDLELIDEAVKALNASYLFRKNTRRLEKIKALQTLSEKKSVDAIDAILEQLDEKDLMIKAAAVSTIEEYGSPEAPPDVFAELIKKTFRVMVDCPVDKKVELMKMLVKFNPARNDFYNILKELQNSKYGHACRFEIEKLMTTASENRKRSEVVFAKKDFDNEPSDFSDTDTSSSSPKALSELEKKRIYLEERRKWIASGKKGDPPQMP